MIKKFFLVDFNIHLIQQLRFIHAIAEAAYPVYIPEDQQFKFKSLTKKFSFKLLKESGKEIQPLSKVIIVEHKVPLSCIGDLCRPLIFPHSICSHCKTLWKDSREMKFSFVGLATRERKKIIDKWNNEQNGNKTKNLFSSAFNILKEKFLLKIGNKMSHRKIGKLHVFSSRRGRNYPTKAWDEQYYQLLAQSEFVLCPRGKSDWTYRFFEATLCGAIPVVEKDCEVYSGFNFHLMEEPIENLIWTREIAEYNYQLCVERITIPLPVLNEKLQSLLK